MIPAVLMIEIYLEMALVLTVVFPLWWLLSRGLSRVGWAGSFGNRRRALRLCFVLCLLAPPIYRLLAQAWPDPLLAVLDDFANPGQVLAGLYLRGDLAIDPVVLERLIGLRDELRSAISSGMSGWFGLLSTLYLIGLIAVGARRLRGYSMLQETLSRCHVSRRLGRLTVAISDEISVPFAAASWRRRFIVLPSDLLLRPVDLRIAMLHEGHHLRAGDLRWLWFLEVVTLLFFWNPMVHVWAREQANASELSCDEAVLREARVSARVYGECLFRACRTALDARAAATPVPIAPLGLPRDKGGAATLLARIESLTEAGSAPSRRGRSSMVLATAMSVGISLLVLDTGGWSTDELRLATVVNLKVGASKDRQRAFGLVMAYR